MWADGNLKEHVSSTTLPDRPPLFEETYTYDRSSNRENRLDARPGAKWNNRDYKFVYDELDRLVTAQRGAWSGTAITRGPGWQEWTLDMLGNWGEFNTDSNGDNDFSDIGEEETRTHNMANELTQRAVASGAGSPYPLTFDANGNITSRELSSLTDRTFKHDAWNRLVQVKDNSTTLGLYQYNGLHWRTIKQGDTGGSAGHDQKRELIYSASWQPIQEEIDDYTNNGSPDGINSRAQTVWGVRYIDDAVLRRVNSNPGSDNDYLDSGDGTFYHLMDAQFSTVAMIDKTAKLMERVGYNAYGTAAHRWPGDVDNSNASTSADETAIDTLADMNSGAGVAITDGTNYDVACDLNRDGVVDSTDTGQWSSVFGGARATLGTGISGSLASGSTDNQYGYDGYVFNIETRAYLSRFRWYEPLLGRWWERDPIGYVDGTNLFLFSMDNPINYFDSFGLCADNDWKSIMDRLGIPEAEAREFAKWLEEIKQDGGIPRSDHLGENLPIIYDRWAKDFGKSVPDGLLGRIQKLYKKLGAQRIAKLLDKYGLAIAMAVWLNNMSEALADPTNPCRKYVDAIAAASKTGKCNEAQLTNLRDLCKDHLLEKPGNELTAIGGEQGMDAIHEAVINACRKKQSCGCESKGKEVSKQ